jgi:type I restriction enzyme, S subunit
MTSVPKLRFSNYKKEWKPNRLSNLGTFKKNYSFSRNLEGEGEYHHIHYGDIHTKYNGIININKDIPSITVQQDDLELVEQNDIIFADASEDYKDLGRVAIVENLGDIKVVSGLHTHCFRPNKNLDPKFFLYYSNTKNYLKFMRANGTGISVFGISKTNLQNLEFLVPEIDEQQRIASFLSLIDKKIEKQQEKVKALQLYKKGMLQKVYSQKIRFKDDNGQEFSNWKYDTLGKFVTKITKKNKDGKITNVISNSAKEGLIAQRDYFDKDIANIDNIDGYYVIEQGDFVYNPRKSADAPYGPINKYLFKHKGIVSPLYLCFKVSKSIDSDFIAYYFKSDKWYRFIHENSDQGARHDRVSIKDSDFFKMTIPIPEIKEQQKIAKFFRTLDKKIQSEQMRLNILTEWKKGLLQKMFV